MRGIDTNGLRPPHARDPGPEPSLGMLPIQQLVIDPEYQRPVGKDGRRAIEKIAAAFEWTKFSTVVVAPVSANRFAIIDGQHRTTAAALCGIVAVPCQIALLDRAGQAAAFSAINGSVTKVTPWVIFKAALAANEAWAVTCRRVAEEAGCSLMTYNKSSATREAGELYGITTFRELIDRHGESTVKIALSAYRKSIYGDLPVAWSNVYIVAWIAAVSAVKGAAELGAAKLALFHDSFDVMDVDDQVIADLRQRRRDGKPAPAHWDALATAIQGELEDFVGGQS